jgi:hypothetical protein
MQGRKALAAAAFIAAASLFAGCGSSGGSGGGGGFNPPPNNGGPSPGPSSSPGPTSSPSPNPSSSPNLTTDSINAANAAGSPVLSEQDLETAKMSPKNGGGGAPPTGQCTQLNNAGYEFFQPDKSGDQESTERIVFYDSGCVQKAMDVVRIVSDQTASTETVTRTITRWSQGQTQLSSRTETTHYSNAQQGFDSYGYPVVDTGLVRESTSTFSLSGPNAFTVNQNDEFIVGAGGSPLTFCADNAGLNAKGTAGFQTQTDSSNGTITIDSSNNIIFTMTRLGLTYQNGQQMTLNTGTTNTHCPISTPAYFVSGGHGAQYTLPLFVKFSGSPSTAIPPVIDMHTVSPATFPNGETLTVATDLQSGSITGTLSNSAGEVSKFIVDGFGDGTLSVDSTGKHYTINSWHVAQ